jgi:Cephalosporin hydroxylase
MNTDPKLKNILHKAIENHRKNNFQEAKHLYNKVLDIDSSNLDAINNLGIIYHSLGKINEAIEFYKKAIDINPNFADSHHNLKLIYFKIGDLENSLKHHIKFLEIKSTSINTSSNLRDIIPKLAKKLQNQNHVPTFFDNAIVSQMISRDKTNIDFCNIFEKSLNSRDNRFISYLDRIELVDKSYPNNQMFGGLPFLLSQGTHSLIKWKDIPLFKSTFDLTIYLMMLSDIKPDYIIELGSGLGSSAAWMADTCHSLGLKRKYIVLIKLNQT